MHYIYLRHVNCPPPVRIPPFDLCLTKPYDAFPFVNFHVPTWKRIYTKICMHPKLKQQQPARERRATTKQNAYIYNNNNNKRKEILCKCVSKCLSWFDKILHSEWLRLVEFGSLVRRLVPVTLSTLLIVSGTFFITSLEFPFFSCFGT